MTIEYRGFVGDLRVDDDSKMIVGKVQNIRSLLRYEGATYDEAVADFHEVVDEYFEHCAEHGIEPERAFTGVFQVRVPQKTHMALATEAAREQVALNTLVAGVLDAHVVRCRLRESESIATVEVVSDPSAYGYLRKTTVNLERIDSKVAGSVKSVGGKAVADYPEMSGLKIVPIAMPYTAKVPK